MEKIKQIRSWLRQIKKSKRIIKEDIEKSSFGEKEKEEIMRHLKRLENTEEELEEELKKLKSCNILSSKKIIF